MELYEILAMPILNLCQIEYEKTQIQFTFKMRKIQNINLLLRMYSSRIQSSDVGTKFFKNHRSLSV